MYRICPPNSMVMIYLEIQPTSKQAINYILHERLRTTLFSTSHRQIENETFHSVLLRPLELICVFVNSARGIYENCATVYHHHNRRTTTSTTRSIPTRSNRGEETKIQRSETEAVGQMGSGDTRPTQGR